jgi:hypothetical protein
MIKVSVSVISGLASCSADNAYLYLDNFAYHKKSHPIIVNYPAGYWIMCFS